MIEIAEIITNVAYEYTTEEQEALDVSLNLYNTNIEALAYLTSTDWMAVREAETGTAMPADVKAKRAEARTAVIT
jgi:hypothetical protein